MFISIGNAKFILVSLQFLTVGKVTKFRAQSTIFSPKSSFYSRFLYFRAWITRITRMLYLYYKLNFRSLAEKKSGNYIFLYIEIKEIPKFFCIFAVVKNNSN